jgi:hypothetical protein
MGKILVQYDELFKAIVINEKYIKGTELEHIKLKEKKTTTTKKKPPKKSMDWSMDGSVIIERSNNITDQILDEYVVVPECRTRDLDTPLCTDMIIIDTPGFNDQCVTDMQKFRANVEVLEFFYKQSSLALFLASPTNLLSISDALKMVQLTMLDPDTRYVIININAYHNRNTILEQMETKPVKKEEIKQEERNTEIQGLMKTVAVTACMFILYIFDNEQ